MAAELIQITKDDGEWCQESPSLVTNEITHHTHAQHQFMLTPKHSVQQNFHKMIHRYPHESVI